jgi:hypothetical protein
MSAAYSGELLLVPIRPRDGSLKPEQYSIAGEGIFSDRWQGNIMASFVEIEDNKYINMDQVRTIVRDPEKVTVS